LGGGRWKVVPNYTEHFSGDLVAHEIMVPCWNVCIVYLVCRGAETTAETPEILFIFHLVIYLRKEVKPTINAIQIAIIRVKTLLVQTATQQNRFITLILSSIVFQKIKYNV